MPGYVIQRAIRKYHWTTLLIKSLVSVCLAIIAISCRNPEGERDNIRATKVPRVVIEAVFDPIQKNGKIEGEVSGRTVAVKSVFDPDRKLLFREQFNSSGCMDWREFYEYDSHGNQSEVRLYRYKTRITTRQVNVYDSAGNLVENTTYDEYGHKIERQTVAYSQEGGKTVGVYRPVNGTFIQASLSVYDARQQNIENRSFSYGNLMSTELNYFDDKGHLVQRTQFFPPSGQERTTLFEHDSINHVTEETILNSSLMMVSRVATFYDEHQNVIKVLTYGVNGNLKAYATHVYEYNEEGHWTKEIMYRNGKPVSVRTRTVEYY